MRKSVQEFGSSGSLADDLALAAAAPPSSSGSGPEGYVIKGSLYQGSPANAWRLSSLVALTSQQQQQSANRRQSEAVSAGPDGDSFSDAAVGLSARVDQLRQALARLKRRPLVGTQQQQPAPPQTAQGAEAWPVLGADFDAPSSPDLPAGLLDALQRHAEGKAPAISCLEPDGKVGRCLTFTKLHSSSRKLAHYLLNKVGHKGASSLKPGDRVALLFPAGDPCTLAVAFVACQMAGLVTVPVETPPLCVPETGQMLISLETRAVLTSEANYRSLKSQSQHEPPSYPGWPSGLHWILADAGALAKPPKDWRAPAAAAQDPQTPAPLAYAECAPARDGSPRAVCVTRAALTAHSRALCGALGYARGDVGVCLLDARRDLGLWHGLLAAAMAGMHVYHVPYTLMKSDPMAWLRLVAKQRAAAAWVRSRDLYWSLLAAKEELATTAGSLSLASLRCLLVADSTNPWSLTSCDSFLMAFRARGLSQNCLVTCAYSPEALTLSLRRPGLSVGRAVVSMLGLSYGAVQVDSDASYTSMTLQDCGHLLPATAVAVVRLGQLGSSEQRPGLCRVDEVGEVCVSSRFSALRYAGADSPNERVFSCWPQLAAGDAVSESDPFVRTGLLGFMGPPTSGGLLFVCGTVAGLLIVGKRRHNADDIIATVLAVEPLRFVFRGRAAVFGQPLLGDERVVLVAEQRAEANDALCHQWACHVLQAVEVIHQVAVYCLALVPPNTLPRGPHGGVDTAATRQLYFAGKLRPSRVLMCPHSAVMSSMAIGAAAPPLPPAGFPPVGAAAIEPAKSATTPGPPTLPFSTLSDALRWRSSREPDAKLFSLCESFGGVVDAGGGGGSGGADDSFSVGEPLTAQRLQKRADRVAALVRQQVQLLSAPVVVAVAAPAGPELVSAVFGCLLVPGCLPVPVRPPATSAGLPAFSRVLQAASAGLLVTTQAVAKQLKTKQALAQMQQSHLPPLPPVLEVEKAKKAAAAAASTGSAATDAAAASRAPDQEAVAYLDFALSSAGGVSGVRVSHRAALAACQTAQARCELAAGRELPICADPYSGMAFILACLSGVACGHHVLLMPCGDAELASPMAFVQLLAQRSARDAFCTWELLERCRARMQPEAVKQKQSLASLRSLVVLNADRPRAALLSEFGRLLVPMGLNPAAVFCSFSCRANPCVGLPTPGLEPATLHVDARALREDRLVPVDPDSPHAVALVESGQPAPDARISIAPVGPGAVADVGEIVVWARGNASGGVDSGGPEPATSSATAEVRTGCLGAIRSPDPGRPPALFVLGCLEDALTLGGGGGQRFYAVDLEATVARSHPAVLECAVFACDPNLLVVVAELSCRDSDGLDLVPLATSCLLREHQLVASVVAICDPGTIAFNGLGQKLRASLRERFLADRLDPVYVAYNL